MCGLASLGWPESWQLASPIAADSGSYRFIMTTIAQPGPAQKLVDLLEGLPASDRKEITAWLLSVVRSPDSVSFVASSGKPPWVAEAPGSMRGLLPRLGSALTTGEESQLVTMRLPAERHNQLRTWCSEHGFTMASVLRGLVERFLEEQAPSAGVPEE